MDPFQYYYLFLALLLPLFLLIKSRARKNGQRLPPGPWRLPVIGSLHHLIGPLPHRTMADLARRHNAPIMYLKLGEVPTVVISSPDGAREVMKTHDVVFATRPRTPTVKILQLEGQGIVFAPYGSFWREIRKICILELLSAKRVQSFRRIREDETARLVESIAAADAQLVNISKRIAMLIADMTVRALIGERFERREEFLETITESIKIVTGFNLGDLFPSSRLASMISGMARRVEAIHRKSLELMECAIEQHRQRRATATASDMRPEDDEDLVDVLLRIQKEGGLKSPLTIGTIKTVIFDIFGAGSETSATTLQWAMSELMRNPRVMQKAQSELRHAFAGKAKLSEEALANLKYLKLVIKETLRLHPTVPLLLPRESREPCRVLGYDVPKGTTVLVNAWAISRDPKYWDDPEEFRPERFEASAVDLKGTDFEFIPFGAGRRMCPGMAFAQASMELPLASLLFHFDWELPAGVGPRELDMTEEMGIAARRKSYLCLRPVVRAPPCAA